jgi:hypothetical protein
MAEQARIEAQLLELEGMRDIQVGLELTHINEDEQMSVDKAPEPRPIDAKLRALEKFVRVEAFQVYTSLHHTTTFLFPFLLFSLTLTLVRVFIFISRCRFFIYIYTHDDSLFSI